MGPTQGSCTLCIHAILIICVRLLDVSPYFGYCLREGGFGGLGAETEKPKELRSDTRVRGSKIE